MLFKLIVYLIFVASHHKEYSTSRLSTWHWTLIQIIVRKSFSMDMSDTQNTIVQLISVIILYLWSFALNNANHPYAKQLLLIRRFEIERNIQCRFE